MKTTFKFLTSLILMATLSNCIAIKSNKHPEIKIKTFGDLNEHLKAIRISKEPNKPTSKSVEKNSFYIQENYEWSVVVEYFKHLQHGCS